MKNYLRTENLKSAAVVMSKEKIRYYLNGVYFKNNGQGHIVAATDGHRLIKIEAQNFDGPTLHDRKDPDYQAPETGHDGFIIPSDAIKSILAAAKTIQKSHKALTVYIELTKADNSVEIVATVTNGAEKQIIPFEPIDGTFPDIERVIPKNMDQEKGPAIIGFNGQYVADMGEAAAIFQGSRINAVKLTINDPSSPCLIGPYTNESEDKLTGVLMPMRV